MCLDAIAASTFPGPFETIPHDSSLHTRLQLQVLSGHLEKLSTGTITSEGTSHLDAYGHLQAVVPMLRLGKLTSLEAYVDPI